MKFNGSEEELCLAYAADPCAKRVAAKFGVKKGCILYWLRKYQIPIINKGGRNLINLIGQKFGDLTVVRRVQNHNSTAAKWLCKCSCGNETAVVRNSLIKGLTTSCGCKRVNLLYEGYNDLSGVFWSRIKHGAAIRNLEFTITIEWAWDLYVKQNKRCALSGVPIQLIKNVTRNWAQQTASLDRIDNNCGYVIGNIQWTHKDLNIMRRKLTVDHFVELCRNVAHYHDSL